MANTVEIIVVKDNNMQDHIHDSILKSIYLLSFVSLILLIAPAAAVAQQEQDRSSLTVRLGYDEYVPGETITISGTVPKVIEEQSLLIRVYDPVGALAKADPVKVFDNGTYFYEFPSGGPLMAFSGEYRVVVDYGGHQAETTFDFDTGTDGGSWTLIIDGKPYVIRYRVDRGSIWNMTADVERKSIVINITSRGDSILAIELPRNVIQAQNSTTGHDVEYVVFIDNVPATFNETSEREDARILEIPIKGDQSEIMIGGTWMVPEFSVSALIFGVSMIAVLLLRRQISASSIGKWI
ncbi:MAG: hypothetical protein ACRD5H_06860 [Nitrososphaerales archaeon]